MIKIGGKTIQIGGFHDHWARTNTDNPTLLMAAMNYYHYDFMCLMDGPGETRSKTMIESYCPHMQMFIGLERFAQWGHIITVHSHKDVFLDEGATPEKVFTDLKEANEFVAMAHPPINDREDGKWVLLNDVGRLMDEGLIPATQVTLAKEEWEWLAQRERDGKITPICSGWDVHLVIPDKGKSPVLYTRKDTPVGHLDSSGNARTLVFAENNEWPAIKEAVMAGQSVVEDLVKGRLLGPSKLIQFLEENGYRQAVAAMDAKHESCKLDVDRKAFAGERVLLKFSTPGKVYLPGSLKAPLELQTQDDGTLLSPPLGDLLDRDCTYMPVVKQEPDGYVRVWAVELHHPVTLDLLALHTPQGPAIEIRQANKFDGKYRISIDGLADISGDATKTVVPLPLAQAPSERLEVKIAAESASGVKRQSEFVLTYPTAPRWRGDWAGVPAIEIADKCAPPLGSQFGAHRPYQGPDSFSAKLQLAWDERALHVRTKVVDPVHFQTSHGHFMYYGDSMQLAIDPLLRREQGLGSMYVYNYCLTPDGPEVFRWQRPDDDCVPGYKAKPGNVSIGGEYLKVTPWEKGMEYELSLPWSELAPAVPAAGLRMGLYYIMFNNNGQGLVDTLHWPKPIAGMWLVPARWGTVTLTD